MRRTSFKGFNQFPIANTKLSSEILFSFDAENRAEVDELAKKLLKRAAKFLAHRANTKVGYMVALFVI